MMALAEMALFMGAPLGSSTNLDQAMPWIAFAGRVNVAVA
jgi:hypothetical protein